MLNTLRKKYRSYERITGMSKIARRYFVMNAFDGALTMFGLIIGSYLARVSNPVLVFSVGMSTALAIGISGLWGAFLTEAAERQRELNKLERSMLRKLDSSYIGEASRAASYMVGGVNALSPFLAGLITLSPFLFAGKGIIEVDLAYRASLGICFGIFFGLGAFLGRISKEFWLISGVKMLLAGLTVALLTFALNSSGILGT
ncbi:hypothetical protein DRN67_00495 [Candidatus Micrarchaeota archaeon]|nr:MAG: hypothetical protein DRN67_00495 [Candidatus Micrarchaeota archaeon]